MTAIDLDKRVEYDSYRDYETLIKIAIDKLIEEEFDFSLYRLELYDQGDYIALTYEYIFRKPGSRGSGDVNHLDRTVFVQRESQEVQIIYQR